MGGRVYFFIFVLLSFFMLDIGPVFATNPNDPASWLTPQTYAATAVHVVNDCTGYGGDTDHDGICDQWEDGVTYGAGLHVVFADGAVHYRYNLSCDPAKNIGNDPSGDKVCPNKNTKDIYVELDSMHDHVVSPTAISDVVSAFSRHGITLHIINGETAVSSDIGTHFCYVRRIALPGGAGGAGTPGTACSFGTATPPYQSYPALKSRFFGNQTERTGDLTSCPLDETPSGVPLSHSYNCLTAKRQVFHYVMFVNYQQEDKTSSGWAEEGTGSPWANPGNDMIVSLGNFGSGGIGTIDEQEASLMHELGHNLGLYHGGGPPPTGDENQDNCKPNYLSIMSYTYEFRKTADVCRPLDYSDAPSPLSTSVLNEPTPPQLTDSNPGSYPYPAWNTLPPSDYTPMPGSCPVAGERPIKWSHPTLGVLTGTTNTIIDWNRDTTSPYSQNLNNLGISGCNAATLSALNGQNDWNFILTSTNNPLVFRGGSNFQATALPGVPWPAESGGYSIVEQGGNDVLPPDTSIVSHPPDPSGSSVSFTSQSDRIDSTFECEMDGVGFSSCSNPQSYNGLANGVHTFQVRATAYGVSDPTPATFSWTVSQSYVEILLYVILAIVIAILIIVIIILIRQ